MSHQYRGDDARVIGKHSIASVGVSKREPGFKLGNRLKRDLVGEGPKKPADAFTNPGSTQGTAMALADQQGQFRG